MKYVDLHSSESVTLKVESSPVWEVILGISGYTHSQLRHTFEFDELWGVNKESMSNSLREALNEIERTNLWYGLIMLQDKIAAENLEDFSSRLSTMNEREFYEALLPYKDREREQLRNNLINQLGNERNFEGYAAYFKGHEYLENYILILEAYSQERLSQLFNCIVTEWYEWISTFKEWTKWNQALAFEEKQYTSLEITNLLDTIETITGGVKYLPEPSIWTVKLVPQVSYKPWTLTLRTADTKLFFYPLKDEYLLEPGTPPTDLIRGHKALGDEVRLKILHQLKKGPCSLQDLSNQFNISKTTIHHQLSLLKAAKFVRVEKGVYSIEFNQLEAFSELLLKFLGDVT